MRRTGTIVGLILLKVAEWQPFWISVTVYLTVYFFIDIPLSVLVAMFDLLIASSLVRHRLANQSIIESV